MKKYCNFFAVLTFAFFNLNANSPVENSNNLLTKQKITFRENKGQVRDQNWKPRNDVLYSGESNGVQFHLKQDGLHYQINRIESWKDAEDFKNLHSIHQKVKSDNNQNSKVPDKISIYRVDVNWKNANKNINIETFEVLPGYDNFYNVPEGNEPALFVKSYKGLLYHNLYEGIDLKFFENEGHLEYDFIVKPKADYSQIKIEIKGAELSISDKNELVITTPFGEIREGALKVYQDNREIYANWVLSSNSNEVSFNIPNYDSSKELRIDPPVRLWGTYYGGFESEDGNSAAIDASGNIYFAGETKSPNNISTTGAHKDTIGDDSDAFLVKFNSNGERQWGTYYGGSGIEYYSSTVTDSYNNVYLAGSTQSTNNISTTDSHQKTYGGGVDLIEGDGFLAKFDSIGIRQWGTYYGGSNDDDVNSVTTDGSCNVYLAGITTSTNNISSTGAHQETYGGGSEFHDGDGFLVKFNENGIRLWGTYYGGNNVDNGIAVATDADENVYLAGCTQSTNNISTIGAHQDTIGIGYFNLDGFLAKFDSKCKRLWATYYGGTDSYDSFTSATTDNSGNIYLSGWTGSENNISTTGAHQETFGGNEDGFLVKFDINGVRHWGTYYGGSDEDICNSVVTDKRGNVYIAGRTTSMDNISTVGAYQDTFVGGADCFLAKFNSNGLRIWGTYYGGSDEDICNSVVTDNNNNIYIAGKTSSSDNISTPGSHQENIDFLWYDGFLVKFYDETSSYFENESELKKDDNSDFVVYPNPATESISVALDNMLSVSNCKIFNIIGMELYSKTYDFPKFDIDISFLPPGLYFIEINGNTKAFIKN